jgi:hypothetical protein
MQDENVAIEEIGQEIVILDKQLSDNHIIPMEIQHELIEMRDRHTRDYFRIGDIVNKLATKYKGQLTKARIERAVGSFVGKTERTCRYYSETAMFYPREVREEYDVLPFSHFVCARGYVDDWRGVLELAKETPYMSVKALEYKVTQQLFSENSLKKKGVWSPADGDNSGKNRTPPVPSIELSGEQAQKKGTKLCQITEYRCAMIVGRIANLVGEVQELVDTTELPNALRADLVLHSAGLQACVEELVVLDE